MRSRLEGCCGRFGMGLRSHEMIMPLPLNAYTDHDDDHVIGAMDVYLGASDDVRPVLDNELKPRCA